jgi:hypothetical protein
MKLSDQAIQEFQVLYEKQFGIQLSSEDAAVEATKLLKLVALIQPKGVEF